MAKDEVFATVQAILSPKWSMQVLRVLAKGPARFSRIKAAMPAISANVLTKRLRSLEEAGIIDRTSLPPPADGLVYVLTPLGEGAQPVLLAMELWASQLQTQSRRDVPKRNSPRIKSLPTGRE